MLKIREYNYFYLNVVIVLLVVEPEFYEMVGELGGTSKRVRYDPLTQLETILSGSKMSYGIVYGPDSGVFVRIKRQVLVPEVKTTLKVEQEQGIEWRLKGRTEERTSEVEVIVSVSLNVSTGLVLRIGRDF